MDDFKQRKQTGDKQNTLDMVGSDTAVGGDQVGGDKITTGALVDSIAAIGAGARVSVYELKGPQEAQEIRNRRQLIQNVRSTWIEGVLNQALHKSAWLELGIKLEPEQVNRPLQLTWELGTEQRIVPLFEEKFAGSLLILGEPGSGKTFTLLELAQKLLEKTEQDLVAPIPVVFNLSSWAVKRQTLHEWLLVELDTLYSVPNKTGRRWLEEDALLLLLDGLDEVAEEHRQACVQAINAYRAGHGLTGIVVCSRSKEYAALTERLNLPAAVAIQPLTKTQADEYLRNMGEQVEAVRTLLREDKVLQEWVQSPLFLYVVAMAYRGLSEEELRSIHTGTLHRLYDEYVAQMLERHRPYPEAPYSQGKTRKWLAFLAARLTERDLAIYQIERMQPDWLPPTNPSFKFSSLITQLQRLLVGDSGIAVRDTQWSWSLSVKGMILGLVGGLVSGLVYLLISDSPRDSVWEVGALSYLLAAGLAGALAGGYVDTSKKPDRNDWRPLVVGLIGGMSGLIVYWRISFDTSLFFITVTGDSYDNSVVGPVSNAISIPAGVLAGGLVGVMYRWLVSSRVRKHEQPNQGVRRSLIIGLYVMLVAGLVFVPAGYQIGALTYELFEGLVGDLAPTLASNSLFERLFCGLGVGLVVCLFLWLLGHKNTNQGETEHGVKWLATVGFLVVLVTGLIYHPITRNFHSLVVYIVPGDVADRNMWLYMLIDAFIYNLVSWTTAVFALGLIVGLVFGLDTFIRHFTLRKLLARYDCLPWRLVPFLEYAKERLLLRRVGGGYIFKHRTLQEYFASQDTSFDESSGG